jgi:hypothetical protein
MKIAVVMQIYPSIVNEIKTLGTTAIKKGRILVTENKNQIPQQLPDR